MAVASESRAGAAISRARGAITDERALHGAAVSYGGWTSMLRRGWIERSAPPRRPAKLAFLRARSAGGIRVAEDHANSNTRR